MTATTGMEQIELTWGERRTVAELRRTERRVLRIEVQPSGQVVVFAPVGEGLKTVRDRAQRKGLWVFHEIDRIAARPAVTPERRFISGETHLLLGRQYRLRVEERSAPEVRLDGAQMTVFTPRATDVAECSRLIEAFYGATARNVFPERLAAMAPFFTRKGLSQPSLLIRPLSKRWGSYTPNGRIVLNVDLVRANPLLIDYVICHELAHGFHPDHGKEWRDLLSAAMPNWEERKAQLEASLR